MLLELLILVARIVLALFFGYNGLNHFRNTDTIAGFAEMGGIPAPRPATYLSGAMLLFGGAASLFSFDVLAAALLVPFLLAAAFGVHSFWRYEGQQAGNQQSHFLKNLALAAAVGLIALQQGV